MIAGIWVPRSTVPGGGDGTPSVHLSRPVDGTTRTSNVLGSLATPWTDTVTIAEGEAVAYELDVSMQGSANTVLYAALAVDGAIIDRQLVFGAGTGDRENRARMGGIWEPGSTGAHTFEVYVAGNSVITITVNSVIDPSTAVSLYADGVSSLRLTKVTLA